MTRTRWERVEVAAPQGHPLFVLLISVVVLLAAIGHFVR